MSTSQRRHRKKLDRAAKKKANRTQRSADAKVVRDGGGNRKAANLLNRGALLREQGRFDDAILTLRRAIEAEPNLARAHQLIASIKKHSAYDDDIKAMETIYAQTDISDTQRMFAAFGLGKAFEDLAQYGKASTFLLRQMPSSGVRWRRSTVSDMFAAFGRGVRFGEYGKAFDFFAAANAIKRREMGYPTDDPGSALRRFAKTIGLVSTAESPIPQLAAKFRNVKALFNNFPFDQYADAGFADNTAVFIVGMPRSGTTLVEQILASHSQVYGTGETGDFARIGGPLLTRFRERTGAFRHCDADEFERIGRDYILAIRKHSKTAKLITDKMPEHFFLLGLIRLALPNAKIIHCQRDPKDICTSIFKQYFETEKGMEYAYDLSDLGQYYILYRDLMSFWYQLLPELIYEVRYEELVADQEQQTRNLLAHCALSWEESCLNFHKTDRLIKTRAEGVRRPMYSDSVHSWKRYEKQMKPLFRLF